MGSSRRSRANNIQAAEPRLLEAFPEANGDFPSPPRLYIGALAALLGISYTVGTAGVAVLVFSAKNAVPKGPGPVVAVVLGYFLVLVLAQALWLLGRKYTLAWRNCTESLRLDRRRWELLLRERDLQIQYLMDLKTSGPQANPPAIDESKGNTAAPSKNVGGRMTESMFPRQPAFEALTSQGSFCEKSEHRSSIQPVAPLNISKVSKRPVGAENDVQQPPSLLASVVAEEERQERPPERRRTPFQEELQQRRQTSDPGLAFYKLRPHERVSIGNSLFPQPTSDQRECPVIGSYRPAADLETIDSKTSAKSNWTHRLNLEESTPSLPLTPRMLQKHPVLREHARSPPRSAPLFTPDRTASRAGLQRAFNFPQRRDSLPTASNEADRGSRKNENNQSQQKPSTGGGNALDAENLSLIQDSRYLTTSKKVAKWVDDMTKGPEDERAYPHRLDRDDESTRGRQDLERKSTAVADTKSTAERSQANESQAVGPPSMVHATPGIERVTMWDIQEEPALPAPLDARTRNSLKGRLRHS